MVVLRLLMKPPFEPMNMASLADMTRKLGFLLTLASAKRNSEVWAFSADVRFGQDYNAATLSFLPNFLAKTMDPSRPETDYAPVTIPALGPSMGEDLPDRLLCPVRALRYYLKLILGIRVRTRTIGSVVCCVPSNLGTPEIYPSRRCQGGSGN